MKNIIRVSVLCMLILFSAGPPVRGAEETLVISPRWETVWLSPRLAGNWVVLRYKQAFPKDAVPTGTVAIDLPEGVTCISAVLVPFEEKPLADGGKRIELPSVKLDGRKAIYLCLSTTLAPGTGASCKISAVWDGGKMLPRSYPIKVIDAPTVEQPKKIRTGSAVWAYQIDAWPDFFKQYKSLGFNMIDYWRGTIHATGKVDETLKEQTRLAREQGIITAIDASGSWDYEIVKGDPESQAIYMSGKRVPSIPCPSYRGPGLIDKMRFNAEIAKSGISFILSDEEHYPNTGAGANICICQRCQGRWREWLPAHYPELKYLPIEEVFQKKKEHPELYRALLWFKASLTTERYRIYKEKIEKAVKDHGAASSPGPMLGWWAGAAEAWSLENAQTDARGLAQTMDWVQPQLYYRYRIKGRFFRDVIRRQCWALDGRNCYAGIDTDDDSTGEANTPGALASSVLETLFAGGKGYCLWYAPYMDTRQWAELARVNGVIAKYERVFLEGKETDLFRSFSPIEVEGLPKDYFRPWSSDVCTSTRENDEEGLLLITDYRTERTPIWVERSLKYAGPMTLYDAFTGEEVVRLTEGRWDFRVHLKELPVKLLYWMKKD